MVGDDESLDEVGDAEVAASDCAEGDDETLCVVCIDAERTHLFLPCAHDLPHLSHSRNWDSARLRLTYADIRLTNAHSSLLH